MAGRLVGGAYPQVLEKASLSPGPGDELVQVPWVEPRVRVRQGRQGAPARGLALHAEPQQFQFFQVLRGDRAKRRPSAFSRPAFSPIQAAATLERRTLMPRAAMISSKAARSCAISAARRLSVPPSGPSPWDRAIRCASSVPAVRPGEMIVEVDAEHADLGLSDVTGGVRSCHDSSSLASGLTVLRVPCGPAQAARLAVPAPAGSWRRLSAFSSPSRALRKPR